MIRTIAACVLAAASVSVSSADVVTTRTGQQYEGKILSETPSRLEIDTLISGIRTTITLQRRQIAKVERKPLPENFFEGGSGGSGSSGGSGGGNSTASGPTGNRTGNPTGDPAGRDPIRGTTPALSDGAPRFMEVPIIGGIGEEVTMPGVEQALDLARRRGVENIVFNIESPGGFVYEAAAIMELLADHDERFNYYAVIERGGAISAATVFVAAADKIFMRSNSSVGGAVAYGTNNSTGATEVDAKFNSIWAADVSGLAGSNGHEEMLFRAMIIPSAEVHMDPETGELSSSRQQGWEEIDNAVTVLTLTASMAEKTGLATISDDGIENLGDAMIGAGWSEMGGQGQSAMQRAAVSRTRQVEALDDALDELNDRLRRASRKTRWSKTEAMREVRTWERLLRQVDDNNDRLRKEGALHALVDSAEIDEIRERWAELREELRSIR
ncbi:MAG: ATP-dependent Clp protease proteolytic subunit [Planctomycetota bacterium]